MEITNLYRHARTATTVLSRVFKPQISRVGLSLTYDCNQKCKTCDLWKVNKTTPELRKKEMTFEEIEWFVAANKKPGLVWCALTGGEPFLKKDMDKIMVEVAKMPSLRLISITTNGSVPDKMESDLAYFVERADPVVAVAVQISFEGPEEDHNEIAGVEKSYERARKSLQMVTDLSKEYPQIRAGISYTLSKFSQGNLRALLEELGPLCPPFDRIHIGLGWDADYYQWTEARDVVPDIDIFVKEVDWFRKKLPFSSLLDPYSLITRAYLRKASRHFNNGSKFIGCAAAQYSCSIDPYWNVHPCTYLFNYTIGSLKDYGYSIQSLIDDRKPSWKPVVDKCLGEGGCKNLCEAYPTILFRPWRAL